MHCIEGDLQTQTEIARECDDLATFSCGDGRLGAVEDEINQIVADIYAGEFPNAVLRVTREMPAGTLVGVAAVEPNKGPHIEHRLISVEDNQDAAFVVVVALSQDYRGRQASKEGLPLSEMLVIDALQHLVEIGAGAIPPVQTIVGNLNRPSRELLVRHGFVCVLPALGASFYVRPRGRPLITSGLDE